MQRAVHDVRCFLRRQRALVAWVVTATVLSYGFATTTFSLSIDEEVHLRFDHSGVWVLQGRFGATLLKDLLGSTFPLPFFQFAGALLLLMASGVAWCVTLVRASGGRLNRSPWLILFAVLYVTMPTHAYFLSFDTFNFEVAFGLLVSACCVYWSAEFRERRTPTALALAAGCALAAVSLYQSLAVLCGLGLLVVDLTRRESEPPHQGSAATNAEPLSDAIRLGAPLAVGVISYVVINSTIAGSDAYVDSFVGWRTNQDLLWLQRHAQAFYGGTSFVGGWIIRPAMAVALLGLLLLAWRAVRQGRWAQPFLWLGIILSPLALSVLLGTAMPNRTQQALPLASASLAPILALSLGAERRGAWAAMAATVLVLALNAQAINQMFLTEHLSYSRDVTIGRTVADRLSDLGWDGRSAALVVVGAPVFEPRIYITPTETIGLSFFQHDFGRRAPYFMNFLGYPLHLADAAELETALAASEAMPAWPRAGSVGFVNNVAILKFGPATPIQRQVPPR